MSLKLEVFKKSSDSHDEYGQFTTARHLEQLKSAAFDAGYAACKDDFAATLAFDQDTLAKDIAQNLQQLSLTQNEARAHIVTEIRPILAQMTHVILPKTAQAALAPMLLETLMPLIDELSQVQLYIAINPAARETVEQLLTQAPNYLVSIEEDETLSEGQVSLRWGDDERCIDLDNAVSEVSTAIHDYFDLIEKGDTNE